VSPYKDGNPTLGEQFEAASEPHQVSEPMNELEAYRHLQKVEGENHTRKQACMAALLHLMVRPENRLPGAEENVKTMLREAIG
jgi:hypothetical protein